MNYENILKQADFSRHAFQEVVSITIPADLETPVSAFLKLRPRGAKLLLESVESGTTVGRYSYIGMKSETKITIAADRLDIARNTDNFEIPFGPDQSPLEVLRSCFGMISPEKPLSHNRLLGGAVGFISYDFIRFIEKLPDITHDRLGIPRAVLYMVDTLLIFDHVKHLISILSLTHGTDKARAEENVRHIEALLSSPLSLPKPADISDGNHRPDSNFTEAEFRDAVREVKKHIVAGDVYQQVISQRLEGTTEADPFYIYRALRMINPSPYMYFLDFDDLMLIGSSPEAMIRLEGGLATARPIAGTRPRGINEEEERKLSEELINDEKERAEHVMLVDLGRNDLGSCCEIGSIRVADFMSIEKYSHVMHITSRVTGRLTPGKDQFDLFAATFPAGTVTGAPKIRAMQLIEEIEHDRRGPYAGAVGYFSLTGDTDWCINIRTILMRGNRYYLQAGAGIVADSIPEKEYTETINKIAALKKAIEIAEKGM